MKSHSITRSRSSRIFLFKGTRFRRRHALGRDRKPTPFQYSPADEGRSVYFVRLTAVGCLKGRRTAVRERRRDDVKKVRFAEYRFQ